MTFTYEYRTADNARHTDVVNAPDREAAFQLLREKGIRPARLSEAPGFFNALFGKGKRWLVIAILAVVLLAVLSAISRNVGLDALVEPQSVRKDDAEVVSRLHRAGQPTEETERFLLERRRMEEVYRAKILQRVKEGELSYDDAAALFRSMGLSTIPQPE